MINLGSVHADIGTHRCDTADILIAVDVSSSVTRDLQTQRTKGLETLQELQVWAAEIKQRNQRAAISVSEAILFQDTIKQASSRTEWDYAKGFRAATLIDRIPELIDADTESGTALLPVLGYAYRKFGTYQKNAKKPYPVLVIVTDGFAESALQRKMKALTDIASNLDMGEKKRHYPMDDEAKQIMRARLKKYTDTIRTLADNNIITIVVPSGTSIDQEEINRLSQPKLPPGVQRTMTQKLNRFIACPT